MEPPNEISPHLLILNIHMCQVRWVNCFAHLLRLLAGLFMTKLTSYSLWVVIVRLANIYPDAAAY